MASKRRIVGVSKTLHFLLPDLVMPMDSKFTMTYFYGYNKYSAEDQKEFESFKTIFLKTKEIIKSLELTHGDVNMDKWNTSVPKLIDNAIIGFNSYWETFLKERDDAPDRLMDYVSKFIKLPNIEKKQYINLLNKLKFRSDSILRKEVERKLIIEKAKKAGITVTDEEIEDELRRRNKIFQL